MLTVTIDQSEGISGADIPEQAVKKMRTGSAALSLSSPRAFLHFLLLNDFPPPSRSLEQANNNTKQLFTEVVPRRKVARLTTRFYTFSPYILFKRRQVTSQFYPTKFIKWVPKPGPTQFYCTYKHRLELFTKWCHWKAVCEGSLWKWPWPSSTTFKNADPGTFYHYFFYYLLNTRTLIILTFSPALLPW